MNALERKLIDGTMKMETELEGLKLPAYGSLFLQDSLPSEYSRYTLPSDLDPTGVFCVGPSCSRAACHKTSIQLDVGPWTSILDFAFSVPHRELARAADHRDEVQRHLHHFGDSQSVDEYCDLLRKTVLVLPILSRDPRVLEGAGSVIWHTDLHLGNIYASDDPTTIEGLIDWQSAQAAPLFIQAQFPELLRPPKNYSAGTEISTLPEDFEELDPDQKEKVAEEQTLAAQSEYYEMSCLGYSKAIYDAMKLDRRLWKPFTYCQLFPNGSMVPLRNSLARLFHDWKIWGFQEAVHLSLPKTIFKGTASRSNITKTQYICGILSKANSTRITAARFQSNNGNRQKG
ncbi:hypothetical protein PENNAL_c0001G06488 [Penicillium nalgiovense]|uniref:Altered inheritance of mitochondria protein 9, mitochondrial n=1 Tax=Penicillium nalgiovense TaxID=60175 RepID=A0A1V6Z9M7_PENNA|nr:hypothetical protein PENNAL_c0001G06488 [Penicillium nalgiovense]